MSYKIPYETCQLFRAEVDADGVLSQLDVRLGLEQIQDTPEFRNIAEIQWEDGAEALVDAFPDLIAERFRAVSDRHARISVGQFRRGFAQVLNDEEFVASCRERWAFQDRYGKPHANGLHKEKETHIDLSAMPDPDQLRA